MSNSCSVKYGAMPERLYVLQAGKVTYKVRRDISPPSWSCDCVGTTSSAGLKAISSGLLLIYLDGRPGASNQLVFFYLLLVFFFFLPSRGEWGHGATTHRRCVHTWRRSSRPFSGVPRPPGTFGAKSPHLNNTELHQKRREGGCFQGFQLLM